MIFITNPFLFELPSKNAKVDTYYYTGSPETWTKPDGAKYIQYLLIGGGGGGGSGRRNASGLNRNGGGGGSGGGVIAGLISASSLNSTESIYVGAGGLGGLDPSSNTNGNNGSNGESTSFTIGSKTIYGYRGNGGEGGTDSGTVRAAGGAATASSSFYYNSVSALVAGGSGSQPTTNATAAGTSITFPTGGGGGGGFSGIAAFNSATAGGAIGNSTIGLVPGGAVSNFFLPSGDGKTSQFYFGTGGAGAVVLDQQPYLPIKGGNGGLYGGGGGGGVGANNEWGGTNRGGDGANGIAVIVTFF